jgi:CelD/BcsL family acetyltransferase involved in cellulose biosynthesis
VTSAHSIALPDDHLALELPHASEREFRIEVVNSEIGFAALRDEWSELLASSRSDSLFLTWEWLHTWWTQFGRGRRLFIVTVRSGSRLVAIAPLTLGRVWVGPVTAPVLEFAGTGSIGSDYLDFIVRGECEAAAISALTSFLADRGISMRLPRVKQTSAVATTMSRALCDRGWQCLEIPTEVCPFIDLSAGSWDSYLNSIGSRHRYNFRRRSRNLARDYEVRFEYVDSEQERREALRQVVNLHLLRRQQLGGTTAFDKPDLLTFHDELSRLALERGWLRLLVLRLNGEPAAAFYGFRYGRTFYFYQSGFDPAFAQHSVGLVMLGLTIRSAIEEGADQYDFLHGDESYKFLWATEVHRLVRLELYPPGRWGRTHRNTARLTNAAKNFAKRVLRSTASPASPTTLE